MEKFKQKLIIIKKKKAFLEKELFLYMAKSPESLSMHNKHQQLKIQNKKLKKRRKKRKGKEHK